jgi:ppGpp synthetase/RelA/SpoT-type nucleotidyltranferase
VAECEERKISELQVEILAIKGRKRDCQQNSTESSARNMTVSSVPRHSKSQIIKAGKVLRSRLLLNPPEGTECVDAPMDVFEAFRIAHNWRDAHMLPLLRVRQELARKINAVEHGAITAARLKRMQAIRRKLQRPITLYQMQDIAGCRAIVRSMKEVDRLVTIYRDGGSTHTIQSEDDYVSSPKRDGYRSHHFILKFRGDGRSEVYNRQTVEIQIRTRLQHAWATAVEAVGLVRGENIKGGDGDEDWRRFFELMSSEIAYDEDRELAPTALVSREEIRKEIRDLTKKIKAVASLEKFRTAIKYTEEHDSGYSQYFLLQFDSASGTVSVRPFSSYQISAEQYVIEEAKHGSRNTVLVQANKVSDLRKAFPNYFLDVQLFTDKLRAVLSPNYRSSQAYDLSWLKNYR